MYSVSLHGGLLKLKDKLPFEPPSYLKSTGPKFNLTTLRCRLMIEANHS